MRHTTVGGLFAGYVFHARKTRWVFNACASITPYFAVAETRWEHLALYASDEIWEASSPARQEEVMKLAGVAQILSREGSVGSYDSQEFEHVSLLSPDKHWPDPLAIKVANAVQNMAKRCPIYSQFWLLAINRDISALLTKSN